MEITEEILTIKEVFEIIRNGFGLGELAELHMENKNEKDPGLISGNIRKNNNSLATTEKLENLVENLIDNYIDPLIELISNKGIIEEYRNQLTKFFKNFDENIIFLNSFCPIKDVQKDILLYLISSEGLKIYYEIKINDKYDPKPTKGSDYTQYNELPKSLKTLIKEKNNKMSKLFDRKASNYLKDNGASMGSRTIVDTKNTTLENTMEGIEEFFVECFF